MARIRDVLVGDVEGTPVLKYAANKSIEEKELLATHGAPRSSRWSYITTSCTATCTLGTSLWRSLPVG